MFGLRRWDRSGKLSINALMSRPNRCRPVLMMLPSSVSFFSLLLLLWLLFSLQMASLWAGVGTAKIRRRPLTTSLRRRLDGDYVRFLAIGGSSNSGFGLDDPDALGYPAILSDGNVYDVGQLVGTSTSASAFAATTAAAVINNKNNNTPKAPSSATTKGASPGGRGWPTLASLCTQSIVGDTNIYDIILIETSYHNFHDDPMGEKNDNGQMEEEISANYNSLSLLASRLRKRFPSAKIIFVQLWHPSQMYFFEKISHDDDDDDDQEYYGRFKNNATTAASERVVVTFNQWRANQQTELESSPPFWGSEKCSEAIQKHDWSISARIREKEFDLYLNRLASEIQATVYKLPRPTDSVQALLRAQHLFWEKERTVYGDEDAADVGLNYRYSLSRYGHKHVADAIRLQILDDVTMGMIPKASDKWRNRIGSWGRGDSCQLWYETNRIDFDKLTYRGLSLRSFSKPGSEPKYALELSSSSETGGTITITNPFPEARMVFLTYMTTSNFAFSNKVYPSTKVQLLETSSVVLDPRHEDYLIRHQIPRTTAIGRIPGNNTPTTIRLDSLENTVSPFRVVGVSLLFPQQQQQQNYGSSESADAQMLIGKNRIPTEFSLITEPTNVGELHTYADFF